MRRFFPIVVIAALVTAWVAGEWFTMLRAVPPTSAQTLAGWLAWQPSAKTFNVLNGGSHLVAFSHGAGLLPSGPSAYVFDEKGVLIDWTGDMDDNSQFQRKWLLDSEHAAIGRSAAMDWIEKRH